MKKNRMARGSRFINVVLPRAQVYRVSRGVRLSDVRHVRFGLPARVRVPFCRFHATFPRLEVTPEKVALKPDCRLLPVDNRVDLDLLQPSTSLRLAMRASRCAAVRVIPSSLSWCRRFSGRSPRRRSRPGDGQRRAAFPCPRQARPGFPWKSLQKKFADCSAVSTIFFA